MLLGAVLNFQLGLELTGQHLPTAPTAARPCGSAVTGARDGEDQRLASKEARASLTLPALRLTAAPLQQLAQGTWHRPSQTPGTLQCLSPISAPPFKSWHCGPAAGRGQVGACGAREGKLPPHITVRVFIYLSRSGSYSWKKQEGDCCQTMYLGRCFVSATSCPPGIESTAEP